MSGERSGRAGEVSHSRGAAARGPCHCSLLGPGLDLTHFFLYRCLRGTFTKSARFSRPRAPLATSAAMSACAAGFFRPEQRRQTLRFQRGGARRPNGRGRGLLLTPPGAPRTPRCEPRTCTVLLRMQEKSNHSHRIKWRPRLDAWSIGKASVKVPPPVGITGAEEPPANSGGKGLQEGRRNCTKAEKNEPRRCVDRWIYSEANESVSL